MTGVQVGVITELAGEGWQPGVMARFDGVRRAAASRRVPRSSRSPARRFVHAMAAYYLILPAEASSNLAKFDAMRYGLRVVPEGVDNPSAEEVMRATRDAGFGDEVKRRIILGTYALSSGYYDAYYGQAQKVRTLISRDFEAAFEQVDVLVSPTAPDHGVQAGGEARRPDRDVPQRPRDHPRQPRRRPRHLGAERPGRRGRPAGRLPDPRPRARRRAGLPRRGRAGGPAGRTLGRPPARPGSRAGSATSPKGRTHDRDADAFDDVLAAFDPAMGLEVHVELNTASKMFCGCPAGFGGEPNTRTCPTCLGLPGAMPVVNGKAVESAIRIGLALNCEIAEWCRFARKNYFYPDMPKNFQTSQYDEPIAFDGWMDVEVDGETFRVEIERAHMEEDTGKSLHVGGAHRPHPRRRLLAGRLQPGRHPADRDRHPPIMGAGERAPEVAKAYVAQLRELILALGVSEARMDQGNLRADVNLSLAPTGHRRPRHPHRDQERQLVPLGRAGRALRDAAPRRHPRRRRLDPPGDPALARGHRRDHQRPREVRRGGLPLLPRARPGAGGPEPRVGRGAARHPPGEPDAEAGPAPGRVGLLRPRDARHRRCRRLRAGRGDDRRRGHPAGRAQVVALRAGPPRQRHRDRHRRRSASPRPTSPPSRRSSTPARINDKLARQVFEGLYAGEGTPEQIVAARGLAIVSDDGALGAAVDNAIAANPDVADKIRDGKVAAAGALIGAVMKEMRGQADAGRVRELILEKLT